MKGAGEGGRRGGEGEEGGIREPEGQRGGW